MGFAYLCFSIIFAFCFPLCSGPLRRLRRHGCGTLLLLRASLRPRKRQTAAPAPLRLFLPQAAPQLRSPARVGGSPLSLAALAGVSPALPEGEPSLRPWAKENFVVRRSFFSFSLPQTLPKPTQVRLPPPRGRWHSALRCDGEGRLPRVRDCAAEALPAAETAEAEQGQRSVFCEGAATPEAKAGHRNRGPQGRRGPGPLRGAKTKNSSVGSRDGGAFCKEENQKGVLLCSGGLDL